MNAVVSVRDLVVAAGEQTLLDGADLTVGAGESIGVVGPSGCGKTTLALALFGRLRPGVRHVRGRCRVAGHDMLPDPAPGVRGRVLGYVAQDAAGALNPYRRVADLVRATAGRGVDVAQLLARVGLPAELAGRYPHQLSGGQQQRVVLALALAGRPRLLVLDEPTSALDLVATRRVRGSGPQLLIISHDLSTVAALTDRVVELERGRVRRAVPRLEAGCTRTPSTTPPVARPATGAPLLTARGMTGQHGSRTVLHGVDVTVHAGRCVAVVGRSGSGKTTLARRLVGLHARGDGVLALRGQLLPPDVRRRSPRQRAALGFVAQNPADALHPLQSVHTALARPLRVLRGIERAGPEVARLLELVALPAGYAGRLPGELSGGQRQRVAIARALAGRPDVLICDEATAALDAETAQGLLGTLAELRAELGLAVLLITHDTYAARSADDLLVLADGRVAAAGPAGRWLSGSDDPATAIARLLTASAASSPPRTDLTTDPTTTEEPQPA